MSLHAQVQFHAKYPLFDSQSERDFTFLAMPSPEIENILLLHSYQKLYSKYNDWNF